MSVVRQPPARSARSAWFARFGLARLGLARLGPARLDLGRPGLAPLRLAPFLVRRLLEIAVTLLAASFLILSALSLAPGTPETFLLGGRSATPEALAAIRAHCHLGDPFFVQYGRWLGQVLHGDFGTSIEYRGPVLGLITARLPGTL